MNNTEVSLYKLKQQQTGELVSRYPIHIAELIEHARDAALEAWGTVGGGRVGQDLLEILMTQVSDVSNTIEILKRQPRRKKKV